ncbi:ATP phosphoribosyltransferase regulatory subunit [Paenactinomyces guangxiensis]|uniref:ATP phosphoribosyltransferase regulatory subunit n=1 Tax=Paenactinomyces guangxiensis TaxID=1490290 RepID=A0A7W2AAH8_9BACL|nr:ATP phosphoribosyltransferase regulatory subunit [Paenactinomyces guangxiensis]MBA4496219.1 ATP phosphoribosyltransferase regulatory subunit [Paenactinomyces guangxiensis]MBH8593308.1 ATP phosphoribosyltransferase regulatory subunit [Paenactinomyces guangxiensis]
MSKPRMFEKPTGFRDFPPQLAMKKRMIEERVQTRFERWGYQEVCTPTLEFFDIVGNASAIPEQKMFKCIDREGNTLVLRPDQTAPIARLVASVLKHEPLPLRLFYHASVFRGQEHEAGRNAEFYQSGVELIGESGAEADAEVLALAVEALKACEIKAFQLTVGHVGLLDGFLRERIEDEAVRVNLKENLGRRDMVSFRGQVQALNLEASVQEELISFLRLKEDRKQFKQIASLTRSSVVMEAVHHLEGVWSHLEDYGLSSYVAFDPGLVGSLNYYTGVYFEGYAAGQGFPLLSGGRYDRLLDCFHRSLPATGFALKTDRLMEACPATPVRPVKIGLFYRPEVKKQAIEKARQWRDEGFIVVSHMLTKQMNPASYAGSFDRLLMVTEGGVQDV